MAQAEATSITSRREFLRRAGTIAAVAPVVSVPVIATASVDPVFAAIERHKAAREAFEKSGELSDAAYQRVPEELRRAPRWGVNVARPRLDSPVVGWKHDPREIDEEAEDLLLCTPHKRSQIEKWRKAKHEEYERDRALIEQAEAAAGYDVAGKQHDAAWAEVERSYEALIDAEIATKDGMLAWLAYLFELQSEQRYVEHRMAELVLAHMRRFIS